MRTTTFSLLALALLSGGCVATSGSPSDTTRDRNVITYDELASIKLYIADDEAEGGFRRVKDGDYVEPVKQTIRVEVSPKKSGERVFVSNGSTYSEEAVMDASGFYQGDFNFGYNKVVIEINRLKKIATYLF